MHVFFHVNEFPENRIGSIEDMLLFCDSVNLWAPSYAILKEAFDRGKTTIRPEDYISLLEAGAVRIVGRKWWIYNEPKRRNHMWRGAPWHDGFDGRILDICEADKGALGPRVLALDDKDTGGDDPGYMAADALIASKDPKVELAKALYRDSQLHRDSQLPLGTAERIASARQKLGRKWDHAPLKFAAREIIRDAFNHEQGRRATASQFSIEPDPFPVGEFALLADRPGPVLPANTSLPSHDKFLEVLDAVRTVSSMRPKNANQILKLRENKIIRDGIRHLFNSENAARNRVASQIADGRQGRNWWNFAWGSDRADNLMTVSGLVTLAYGIWSLSPMSLIGLGIWGARVARPWAERKDLIREKSYSGPKWPFMLAFDARHPGTKQIDDILASLMKRRE